MSYTLESILISEFKLEALKSLCCSPNFTWDFKIILNKVKIVTDTYNDV